MRTQTAAVFAVLGTLATAFPVPAASLAQAVTASANIDALAKLTLSPATLLFPDSDPDVVPVIPAAGGPIAISAKARTPPGGRVTLTLQATDDLRSGMDIIPVDALQWTATGSGFMAGTASRADAQTVASWTGSGARAGTQSFSLANTWARATGTYTVTLVYTLVAE
jgi:hypothetical protein